MKKVSLVCIAAMLMSFVTIASAETFTVPAGSTITATPAGAGSVKITWSGFTVDQVVRFHLVEPSSNGQWASTQNPPSKEATLTGVCANNSEYPFDARFQLKDGGKWSEIWPVGGVQHASLTGVHPECKGSAHGCALEIDEPVINQVCGKVATK